MRTSPSSLLRGQLGDDGFQSWCLVPQVFRNSIVGVCRQVEGIEEVETMNQQDFDEQSGAVRELSALTASCLPPLALPSL
ncbi:hypothetical protein VM1G_11938 [Cytospora mali]|uniref:Uncharacterized protein n=1 Tax=Cytospora mali TaxID=578113 RepID=A0A194WBI0_CYTMA|nr:hypothetical protein VM1G_11938 [Valsa mali]